MAPNFPDAGSAALFQQIQGILHQARRPLVLTGAGLSAADTAGSGGLGTFQDSESPWIKARDPAWGSTAALKRDPTRFWTWGLELLDAVAASRSGPLPGHEALARWMAGHGDRRLITQNVDGLHRRTLRSVGVDPQDRILEIHGTMDHLRCTACRRQRALPARAELRPESPPTCLACGHLLEPAVVWMGDLLDESQLQQAYAWTEAADAALVIGTSGNIQPVGDLPRRIAGRGHPVIVVDPDPTAFMGIATHRIIGSASEVLPTLLHT